MKKVFRSLTVGLSALFSLASADLWETDCFEIYRNRKVRLLLLFSCWPAARWYANVSITNQRCPVQISDFMGKRSNDLSYMNMMKCALKSTINVRWTCNAVAVGTFSWLSDPFVCTRMIRICPFLMCDLQFSFIIHFANYAGATGANTEAALINSKSNDQSANSHVSQCLICRSAFDEEGKRKAHIQRWNRRTSWVRIAPLEYIFNGVGDPRATGTYTNASVSPVDCGCA